MYLGRYRQVRLFCLQPPAMCTGLSLHEKMAFLTLGNLPECTQSTIGLIKKNLPEKKTEDNMGDLHQSIAS